MFPYQELQVAFEEKMATLETACEKGKLLVMMESCSPENNVETEVAHLKEIWDALRCSLTDNIDLLEAKSEEVEQIETEILGVSEKLNELQSSTEDLKCVSLVNGKVENLRENFEVSSMYLSNLV
jgi:hypothetical protein